MSMSMFTKLWHMSTDMFTMSITIAIKTDRSRSHIRIGTSTSRCDTSTRTS
jgi:hypothetical protein